MPARPGGNGSQVRRQYASYVGRMTGPRTRAGIANVMSAGLTNAIEWTPEEYGELIKSKFRRIEGTQQTGYTGICGFMAGYATYLHGTDSYTPLWKPVAPEDKAGPAWNPFARPRFLELGFTGPLAREQIQRIIAESYR